MCKVGGLIQEKLAESSKEGCGPKRVVLSSMMMMTKTTAVIIVLVVVVVVVVVVVIYQGICWLV
jgi:hypothetical protein